MLVRRILFIKQAELEESVNHLHTWGPSMCVDNWAGRPSDCPSRSSQVSQKGSTSLITVRDDWLCRFQFSFESLYRSLNYALLDNACREYLFVVDFFAVSGDDALALFNAIFGRTLQILQVQLNRTSLLKLSSDTPFDVETYGELRKHLLWCHWCLPVHTRQQSLPQDYT